MGHLSAVYIFGSVGRGDEDDRSDLDLLAIVRNGGGTVADEEVLRHVPAAYSQLKPSISWYGHNRLGEMFKNGELFAWHLYAETKPLFEDDITLKQYGVPGEYRDAVLDVESFYEVLLGIPEQIAANERNAVYECGLIYVCLRNIAMSASSTLNEKPDFSRYSPFKLNGVRPCPISVDEYEISMESRMASQRGLTPPFAATAGLVRGLYERLTPWISDIMAEMGKRQANG
ncbi:hypothetical protein [Ferrovibrio sp.]|uniref:hypothetical protein n=1 Tax=Ferrovibrio sp. TaxID=1917215 RepID=UPI003D112E1B